MYCYAYCLKSYSRCTHCSYTTKSSRLLDYHQNVHTGKFKCKICDKLFTRKIYLTYHLNDIHRKTRHLHGCEECSARFVSSSGLKMHMQWVHILVLCLSFYMFVVLWLTEFLKNLYYSDNELYHARVGIWILVHGFWKILVLFAERKYKLME